MSATNPVYATCDTLTSVTAGMVECLDDDPPGYSTVEMVLSSAHAMCMHEATWLALLIASDQFDLHLYSRSM